MSAQFVAPILYFDAQITSEYMEWKRKYKSSWRSQTGCRWSFCYKCDETKEIKHFEKRYISYLHWLLIVENCCLNSIPVGIEFISIHIGIQSRLSTKALRYLTVCSKEKNNSNADRGVLSSKTMIAVSPLSRSIWIFPSCCVVLHVA